MSDNLNNKGYLLELAQIYDEVADEFKIRNPAISKKYEEKAKETREKYNVAVEQNLKGVQ